MPDGRATSNRVWVVDSDWDAMPEGETRKCRMPRCPNPAVARLFRRPASGLPQPWAYCEEHLYGRRLIDGVVHAQVAADSKSARRGHTMILNERFGR